MARLTRADLDGLRAIERARLKDAGIQTESVVSEDRVRRYRMAKARNARVQKLLAGMDKDRRISRAELREVMGHVKKKGDKGAFEHGRLSFAQKRAKLIRLNKLMRAGVEQ